MVRAQLRHVVFEPDPWTLPADPAGFEFVARLLVGPSEGPGEESFDVTVCSPQCLELRCASGAPVSGWHHVIVGWETYDERVLRSCVTAHVRG